MTIKIDKPVTTGKQAGSHQGIALETLVTIGSACPARACSILPIGVNTTLREVVLDQFAACWEELDDLRTGNAALHDFNELSMIVLCTALCGGAGRG